MLKYLTIVHYDLLEECSLKTIEKLGMLIQVYNLYDHYYYKKLKLLRDNAEFKDIGYKIYSK